MPTIFQNIQLSNLPSKKFDNLKISINYELLQSYNKNTISTEKISSWIENFKTNIEKYLINQSAQGLIQKNKGCKDFNYIIEKIKQKIHSLFNNITDIYKWTQEIKNWRSNYFRSNTDLKCNENDKYIKPVLKDLYDFCEDKIFIEENLRDIESSLECQSIYADLSERKVQLKKNQSIIERHIERKHIPDISCSTEILNSTFPSINCSVIYKHAPVGGAHISNANHNGIEESKERLVNQSMHTLHELSNREQGLYTVQRKNETNSDSPSNSIGFVSFPILGTLVLSFLLYRVFF